MKKYIKTTFKDFLNEDVQIYFTIDSFPDSIKKTLEEYSMYYVPEYDWNSKQEEYTDDEGNYDGVGFGKWLKESSNNGLRDNINTLIGKIDEDIKLLEEREIADEKLKAFEELIIPSLGNEVLSPALNKYQERVLMNPYATKEEIEKGFREGQSIFDKSGDIDQSKIEMSNIFDGGGINLPAFEKFVEKNPDFQGVFDDWYKIFNDSIELSLKDLNAFRSSTTKESMVELKKFLLEYKSKNNL